MKKNNVNANKETVNKRVFAKGYARSENIRETGLNNNVLAVGNPGSGKTTGIVIPTMASTEGSIVVVDTKCQLYKDYAEFMRQRGYKVKLIDFVNPEQSMPFNILDSVKRFKKRVNKVICPAEYDDDGSILLEADIMEVEVDSYRQMDVQRLSAILIPDDDDKEDRFWVFGARIILEALIAYVIEALPKREQHMGSVSLFFREMCRNMADGGEVLFFNELEGMDPESFAVRRYKSFCSTFKAEKTWVCMMQFVSNALSVFEPDENAMMLCKSGLDLAECGRERTALFVNVSDTDRAMDRIVNAFYTQLFQLLVQEADGNPDGRLKVPCHILLDDFACNVFIPDFDKLISVIRSRDISATVILQSVSQLKSKYNAGQAVTIINGCDTVMFLGGSDPETARFFADKAAKLPESMLGLDQDHLWIFTRGQRPVLAEKLKSYQMDLTELSAGK